MQDAADLLWLVYPFLFGGFVLDLMLFTIFVWWGHKKAKARR